MRRRADAEHLESVSVDSQTRYFPRLLRVSASPRLRVSNRGFTLLELLTTVAIMGLLTTVGTVSYESVRASSRDAKRVSDTKAIQAALEWYYEDHQGYPPDTVGGPDGVILGETGTAYLTDSGWSATPEGRVYLIVPKNPVPNGSPYVYRSLQNAGGNCEFGGCESFALNFTLEKAQGSYMAGPHALTPQGIIGPEGGTGSAGATEAGGQIVGLEGQSRFVTGVADTVVNTVQIVVSDPTVGTVAEKGIAPAATGLSAVNTAASFPSGALALQYILAFLTQPFALLSRRTRKRWGVVYNSLSKLPEDLVIVRLRDAYNGRVQKSAVTDSFGSYSFLVKRGSYRIEAVKVGFAFPSSIAARLREDAQYADVYHGEEVGVGENGALLTPNIPIDPEQRELSDEEVIRRSRRRGLHRFFAALGPLLGGLALAVRPNLTTALMFLAQVVLYMMFRRLSITPEPKSWGIIYDEENRRPVSQAVVRIFALPYHKLLETQVTDSRGRYHFRVGSSLYYLTVSKPGFIKTETDPLDLRQKGEPSVISTDLPLRSVSSAASRAVTPPPAAPPAPVQEAPASPAQPARTPAPDAPPPAAPPMPPPAPSPAQEPPSLASVPEPPPTRTPGPEITAPPSEGGEGKSAEPPPMGDVR